MWPGGCHQGLSPPLLLSTGDVHLVSSPSSNHAWADWINDPGLFFIIRPLQHSPPSDHQGSNPTIKDPPWLLYSSRWQSRIPPESTTTLFSLSPIATWQRGIPPGNLSPSSSSRFGGQPMNLRSLSDHSCASSDDFYALNL